MHLHILSEMHCRYLGYFYGQNWFDWNEERATFVLILMLYSTTQMALFCSILLNLRETFPTTAALNTSLS